MFNILVVCTANICRSPVAQVFLSQHLSGKQVQIQSAGTLAVDGNYADSTMQILMNTEFPEMSPQLSNHFSRALMPSHLSNADLVLCMEQSHLDWVNKLQPIALGKTKLLTHWGSQEMISDPVGSSKQTYWHSFKKIESACELWSQKIQLLGMCK